MRSYFILFYLALFALSANAQKKSRLIRQVDSTDNGDYIFTNYKYSSGRGDVKGKHIYGYDYVMCDTALTASINGITFADTTLYLFAQRYDSQNNLLSVYENQNYSGLGFGSPHKDSFTYIGKNIFFIRSYGFVHSTNAYGLTDSTKFTYNSHGLLKERTMYNFNYPNQGGKREFEYDNVNNLISETQLNFINGQYSPAQKISYTYANGNLMQETTLWGNTATSDWDTAYAWKYLYNSAGLMVSKNLWQLYHGIWIQNSIDSSVYVNGNKVFQYWYDFNGLRRWTRDSNSYDAANNLIYSAHQYYDSASGNFVGSQYQTTTYNSYNQPVKTNRFQWDPTTGTWIFSYNPRPISLYFYEEYDQLAITELKAGYSVNIYPSPANNYIRLDISSTKQTEYKASIYNMQGRLLRQWAQITRSNTIPVSDLPNGNYILQLSSDDGTAAKRFTIER